MLRATVVGAVLLVILGVLTAFFAGAMQEGSLREFTDGIKEDRVYVHRISSRSVFTLLITIPIAAIPVGLAAYYRAGIRDDARETQRALRHFVRDGSEEARDAIAEAACAALLRCQRARTSGPEQDRVFFSDNLAKELEDARSRLIARGKRYLFEHVTFRAVEILQFLFVGEEVVGCEVRLTGSAEEKLLHASSGTEARRLSNQFEFFLYLAREVGRDWIVHGLSGRRRKKLWKQLF